MQEIDLFGCFMPYWHLRFYGTEKKKQINNNFHTER